MYIQYTPKHKSQASALNHCSFKVQYEMLKISGFTLHLELLFFSGVLGGVSSFCILHPMQKMPCAHLPLEGTFPLNSQGILNHYICLYLFSFLNRKTLLSKDLGSHRKNETFKIEGYNNNNLSCVCIIIYLIC